jgi:SRSO17 transposase
MAKATLDWMKDLERWLRPFLGRLGHKTRRQMCPAYVSGLIGPGDRKSVQPMAERLALGSYDRLHHFISSGVWDAAPIEAELIVQADKLVGGRDAVLVIDDTAMLKKGKHSVGVAPQYCSTLGKIANCQTLVSLTLARREVPIMLALRLFLPESWTSDPSRLKRAGVPTAYRKPRTKSEVALEELDRVIAAGVRFGCVLTDAGYGQSASFRQELTARELRWAVGIPRHLKVYPADVKMIRSMVRRGRPRRPTPHVLSRPAEHMLGKARWRKISWRAGTKGKLKARFAALRVRVADGSTQWIRDKSKQHLPGEEVWLVGEHRDSGEKKYYLANLPTQTDLRTLAATIKARWVCEQAHQQLKLIFDSANSELIDLLRESAPQRGVGTTFWVDSVAIQAWSTWRTVGGRATPAAESARLAAGRGGERSRKHLSSCSTLVSVSESRSARISGHEPFRPRSAMRSSSSFLRTRARKLQDT